MNLRAPSPPPEGRGSYAEIPSEHFDVVVIGAGIHGAGVAQAAAARGYSVLVLEQTAAACGTSSRSSKLIHGGLRYLESGQFALVRECLRERELLLKLAPDLVKLVPFYIPVYRNTTRAAWKIHAGLSLYTLLGGLGEHVRFARVPRAQWDQLDGITTQDLRAVYRYYDAQTDDAALTRAVLRSAQDLGATVRIPARFDGAQLHERGARVRYTREARAHECETTVLINAAGPWATRVLEKVSPTQTHPPVDLVQGAHIIVDGTLREGIYYVEAPRDRRAVFVMPWQNRILIGTTETLYHGDPAQVQPLPSEIDYLLETFRHYFPHATHALAVEAFAGLRVLPHRAGNAFHRPRDTTLLVDRNINPRLLSILGGKLTAYRATAEKIVSTIAASLPARELSVKTQSLRLRSD